jgi:hypothetical protein
MILPLVIGQRKKNEAVQPSRPSVDQARLRPHLRGQLVQHQADVLRQELDRSAAGGNVDRSAPRSGWKTPVGDDLDRLRGLPVAGTRVGGTSPGTDPLGALLEKVERRSRSRSW